VLNSKNFGVPQNRERVFIVGHLRGTTRPEVFPIGEADGTTDEGYKPYSPQSEVAQTIRTRYGNGTGSHIEIIDKKGNSKNKDYASTTEDIQIRRLTPTECERLQGFPDGWTKIEIAQTSNIKKALGIKKYMSDSQRYKCLGNAVTVNVIEYIVKRLIN